MFKMLMIWEGSQGSWELKMGRMQRVGEEASLRREAG